MGTFEIGVLYFSAAFVALMSGMPVAFALGAVALLFMLLFMPPVNVLFLAETLYSELDNFTLLCVPLFVLMGTAIGKTRASVDLYDSLHHWLHRLPGGLGVANVFGCAVFAAMCGSSPATCAAIGGMGIPEMMRRGYPASLATGLIAAGGTLGILIPPSLTMIIYGIIVEQSIGRLFIAGVVPGVLLAILFAIWVVAYSYVRQRLSPVAPEKEEHYTWKKRWAAVPRFLPFLGVIAFIMFAMYGGLATPSEVAGIGAIVVLAMVMAIYGSYRWADIKGLLSSTISESCMLMMIVAMSFLFTYVMSYLHITQSMAQWLVGVQMSKWTFLLSVNVFLLALGCFLPPVAIILMVTPVVYPAVVAHGIDPIWFGVILTINMELGMIHPPVGLNLFVINGIVPEVSLKQILLGVAPFIVIMLAFMVLLTIVPEIATWLPNLVMGEAK
jgi:tripartite ATP-independent transporter DctM subunit